VSTHNHNHLPSDKASDPYALYASPIGPRILEHANKIFEDFPVQSTWRISSSL